MYTSNRFYNEEVFLLSQTPYRSSDLIVTFLSPQHGQITGIIYQAKKTKKGFSCNLGEKILLEYQHQEHKEFIQIQNFQTSLFIDSEKISYHRFVIHSYFLEVIKKITVSDDSALQFFHILDNNLAFHWNSKSPLLLVLWFLSKLLMYGGFQIRYDDCASCNQPTMIKKEKNVQFRKQQYKLHHEFGELYCFDCSSFSNADFTPAMIKLLWLTQNADHPNQLPENIPTTVIQNLIDQLNQYSLEKFEIRPKSLPLFLQVIKKQIMLTAS
ncbi:MAG: DNA repair protein RecO [bacterium]|jgi:DNA repair protein RecO